MVDLEKGEIAITAEVSKVSEPRATTIQPNLAAWMRAYPLKGSAMALGEFKKRRQAIWRKLGLTQDVMRHTFISMFVAKFRSIGEAAIQAGNSEAIIRRHYLNLKSKEEAENFFNIVPRRVDQFRGQIAAIVFEPVLCNTCCLEPVPGMLATIRELCDRDGMLMISDETTTGFRFGAACAQGYYGYRADLTILGKAIGGGTPFAALAGTRAAFTKILSGEVVHAGTLNANPLCLAAGRWCLDEVIAQGADFPATTQRLGKKLMAGLADLARAHAVPLRPQGPGLIFHGVMLKPGAAEGPIRDYRDYVRRHDAPRWAHLRRCLLEEGVHAIERGIWSISTTHTEADLAEALARSARAIARHAAEWKPAA